MGSSDFSVPSLKALLDAGHQISCVYTQPIRAAGRGQKKVIVRYICTPMNEA